MTSVPAGITIDEAELQAAFEFFDVSGTGKITLSDLKNRLGAFYKNVPLREYKFLMNNQSELTLDDLRALLENNEIKNFDPVAEAFKVYDPQETGFVDTGVLRGIFEKLGFGTITEEDVRILIETADVDKDGKISLDDFRKMIDTNQAPVTKK
jgi:Ca2+-binding EF-hand superfamily protein|tara:strand:+ start:23 stop:481 length:459 start_codon:yes stop_codon:yes gene_type:complete